MNAIYFCRPASCLVNVNVSKNDLTSCLFLGMYWKSAISHVVRKQSGLFHSKTAFLSVNHFL